MLEKASKAEGDKQDKKSKASRQEVLHFLRTYMYCIFPAVNKHVLMFSYKQTTSKHTFSFIFSN